jgi:hypothetical protein
MIYSFKLPIKYPQNMFVNDVCAHKDFYLI